MKKEIIISGTGGQGIILAGVILSKAAVIDGYKVVQSQNYGPESRGGASRCDVIISDKDIFYPKVSSADYFVSLSQDGLNNYKKHIRDKTYVIVDKNININVLQNVDKIDIIEYVYKTIKNPQSINMFLLGILTNRLKLISQGAVKASIEATVPPKTLCRNLKAFELGMKVI